MAFELEKFVPDMKYLIDKLYPPGTPKPKGVIEILTELDKGTTIQDRYRAIQTIAITRLRDTFASLVRERKTQVFYQFLALHNLTDLIDRLMLQSIKNGLMIISRFKPESSLASEVSRKLTVHVDHYKKDLDGVSVLTSSERRKIGFWDAVAMRQKLDAASAYSTAVVAGGGPAGGAGARSDMPSARAPGGS